MEIYDNKNEVIVEMALPHLDPEKIDISVQDNLLHIQGFTEKKSEVEDKNFYRREISAGTFYRAVFLPSVVQADHASAEYKQGVLKITLPKAKEIQSQPIKVKVLNSK